MTAPPGHGTARRFLLLVYELVGLAAVGVFACVAALGTLGGRDDRRRSRERLGRYAGQGRAAADGPVVWLHAASVGEIRAIEPLLAALRDRLAGARFVLTCQTATGRALAATLAVDEHRYFPVDARFVVRRALSHFRPSCFVFVETEIWPRLLLELAAAGVPAVMVSARVSETSFHRYRRMRGVFGPALATLSCVCARDEASRARLVELGAPSEHAVVCGDIKLDALDRDAVAATRDALGERDVGVRLLFAVSTHEGEETIILDAFARVRSVHAAARLVLAPRHPRRGDDVAALAADHGRVSRWSRDRNACGWDVLVIDTTGDARTFFPSAECAFVGGSLIGIGGHNLAEVAAFGVPCAAGPHLENVRHQAELLRRAGALSIVRDAESLARVWSAWLADPVEARRVGDAGRDVIAANRGAVERTLDALEPVLARIDGSVPA